MPGEGEQVDTPAIDVDRDASGTLRHVGKHQQSMLMGQLAYPRQVVDVARHVGAVVHHQQRARLWLVVVEHLAQRLKVGCERGELIAGSPSPVAYRPQHTVVVVGGDNGWGVEASYHAVQGIGGSTGQKDAAGVGNMEKFAQALAQRGQQLVVGK